ncbi:hypothetical protein CEUSTIGMA_g7876.t1 [Chlamydomonas eustigma]|uniref:Uncharacterized protein n=1 Tax=Chlamydomonas eustigma TaxID=1157962 RepID=A0A250XBI3_9CHLO|nr:hypothetical protein CEUSTIGMA_g7876.t1 [Chlamydomonas eustigma]|eukprot:GAX80437.1 hypothetical protein CEUSTIGMA_g7876.t1 [Chlamydomonas eustigma]
MAVAIISQQWLPAYHELALMFLLLGAVYIHDLPQLAHQLHIPLTTSLLTAAEDIQTAINNNSLEDMMSSLTTAGANKGSWQGYLSTHPVFSYFSWDLLHVSACHVLASAAVLVAPGALAWGMDFVFIRNTTIKSALGGWTQGMRTRATTAAYYLKSRVAGREREGLQDSLAISTRDSTAAASSVIGSSGRASVLGAEPSSFLQLGYGYLPLCWAATLAHYLPPFLTEAGSILQVTAHTFGSGQAVSGWLPVLWSAHPAVVSFLQGGTLLAGLAASLALSRKLGGQAWIMIWPQCLLLTALTLELWCLEQTFQ